MKRGFYTIMAAQFFSSLADNALLIVAIAILADMTSPNWMTPLLKLFFALSYVLLAAFVGAFADSLPKGRVMFITNLVKISGCLLMFASVHPLLAYGIVGFGAAAYSPAKYGILTELLPAEKLVAANGWIEGLTISSILLGTVLGGTLVNDNVTNILLDFNNFLGYKIDPSGISVLIIGLIYLIAALFNLHIPDTGVRYPRQKCHPFLLISDFSHCLILLWRDKLGQVSLAVTTLFWGAGATLQFIVIKWAEDALGISLDKAAFLQGVVAIGVAIGAVTAARIVSLKRSLTVMPMGAFMGCVVMLMTLVHSLWLAYILLIIIGILSGYFVVPMNALLQHRGHILMSAGHSIAVQNFNENLSILVMLGIYSLLIMMDLSPNYTIILFGSFIVAAMILTMIKHSINQREFDSVALIGQAKSPKSNTYEGNH